MKNELDSNYANVFKTDDDRDAANLKWKELKQKLRWNCRHYRYIKLLKNSRKPIAHPEIDWARLRQDLQNGTLKPVVQDEALFKDLLDMMEQL